MTVLCDVVHVSCVGLYWESSGVTLQAKGQHVGQRSLWTYRSWLSSWVSFPKYRVHNGVLCKEAVIYPNEMNEFPDRSPCAEGGVSQINIHTQTQAFVVVSEVLFVSRFEFRTFGPHSPLHVDWSVSDERLRHSERARERKQWDHNGADQSAGSSVTSRLGKGFCLSYKKVKRSFCWSHFLHNLLWHVNVTLRQ